LATAYLFTDRVNRRFVLNRPIQLIVIPILLFTGGVLVFMRPQNPVFVPALLLLFLYQTWHFGSQNIGVAMFISLSERGKAISPGEKNIIRMGTVCGMLGVLSALYPGFMIGQQYVHIDATPLAAIRFLHDVGTFVALALTGGALLLLLKAWHQRQFIYGAAIFLSVTFLFPMYISENYMIAVASFTIAHGLQYVVFLAAHSLSPPKSTRWRSFPFLAILIPPLILAGIVGTGHLIWTNAPTFQSDLLPLVGLSIILGLTLSHFWIDQFMWRMRNSERAKWVRQNYGFIFRSQ
jgi:nitrate reductase NapE component